MGVESSEGRAEVERCDLVDRMHRVPLWSSIQREPAIRNVHVQRPLGTYKGKGWRKLGLGGSVRRGKGTRYLVAGNRGVDAAPGG